MKKTINHGNKVLTIEFVEDFDHEEIVGFDPNVPEGESSKPIMEKVKRHLVKGYIGKELKSEKIIRTEDPDLVNHLDAMENELIQIVEDGKPDHQKKLLSKGFK